MRKTRVILSIYPEYVHAIRSRSKQYEHRKIWFHPFVQTIIIPAEIQISVVPVSRDDAAADVGRVRQENTEDGTTSEGTVRFDILFELALPGSKDPVLLVINVEVQNRRNLPYPLERSAMVYASRLVGRQGTDYAGCKKVYSVWIVSGPQKRANENTIVKLVTA